MLSELHIENIAVIERADIVFDKGLNVLGGETGAGKSIVIDSINAVLGNRTSRELVRKGASSGLVTAVFTPDRELPWLQENDIPYEGELILQRKITPEGKSSSRVCGIPVAAAQHFPSGALARRWPASPLYFPIGSARTSTSMEIGKTPSPSTSTNCWLS